MRTGFTRTTHVAHKCNRICRHACLPDTAGDFETQHRTVLTLLICRCTEVILLANPHTTPKPRTLAARSSACGNGSWVRVQRSAFSFASFRTCTCSDVASVDVLTRSKSSTNLRSREKPQWRRVSTRCTRKAPRMCSQSLFTRSRLLRPPHLPLISSACVTVATCSQCMPQLTRGGTGTRHSSVSVFRLRQGKG
jgi:hypothetical protein